MTSRVPQARFYPLNYIRASDYDTVALQLKESEYSLLTLNGALVRDTASFLTAASTDLLQGIPAPNWSSFEDSFRDLIWTLDDRFVALVWTDAHRMLQGGLGDLVTALTLFTRVSELLKGNHTVLAVFLFGDGPNFPQINE